MDRCLAAQHSNNAATMVQGHTYMLDNRGWERELRNANNDFKYCQFPHESEIAIRGDRDHATISITRKGLHANMQTDAAAFEAWALVLLCHCGVTEIEIALEGGTTGLNGETQKEPHFQRFLYRLKRFIEVFPSRVVADRELLSLSRAAGSNLYLNQPLNHRIPVEDERDARFNALLSKSGKCSESDLEKALEASPACAAAFGKVMRQWPVGLFRDKVANGENRIFTGGKSAIDLIGIRNDQLALVELKKDGNRKVGALSELFFYSCLMRDAVLNNFQFEDRPPRRNCSISTEDIRRCSKILAVLLAPAMHPLIENAKIISELNSALADHWPNLPVKFEALHLRVPKAIGEDFVFG